MNPTENLHYAIGQLACAVAFADGKIQKEEWKKFHDIVVEELKNRNYEFDVSDIVFQIMEKVASAYPPVTKSESFLIAKFKKDIAEVNGDPVYYAKN
jgi:hypothetical protein